MLYRRVKCRENVITKYMYACEVKSTENFFLKQLHVYFMLMKKIIKSRSASNVSLGQYFSQLERILPLLLHFP